MTGRLVIRGPLCYLIDDIHSSRAEIQLLLEQLPTGAAWYEGFLAAKDYFANVLGKDNGDRVSFEGAFCSFLPPIVAVRDQRLSPVCAIGDSTHLSRVS